MIKNTISALAVVCISTAAFATAATPGATASTPTASTSTTATSRIQQAKAVSWQSIRVIGKCGARPAQHVFVGIVIAGGYVAPMWVTQTLLSAAFGPQKAAELLQKSEMVPAGEDVHIRTAKLIELDKSESVKLTSECKSAARSLVQAVKATSN